MSHKTLEEKEKEIQAKSETMDEICAHVASGGSLIDLCEVWGVRYGRMSAWIRLDKEKSDAYEQCLADRGEWFKESILNELRRISTSDIRKLYNEDGNLKPVHEWPSDVAHFVKSIDQVEEFEGSGKDRKQIGWVKKVSLWNKEKGLELLGKNLSMFIERIDLSKKITLEDLVNESREGEDV